MFQDTVLLIAYFYSIIEGIASYDFTEIFSQARNSNDDCCTYI